MGATWVMSLLLNDRTIDDNAYIIVEPQRSEGILEKWRTMAFTPHSNGQHTVRLYLMYAATDKPSTVQKSIPMEYRR